MTSNQIAYWQLQNEKQRTAIQRDAHEENVRHNKVGEQETARHNLAGEQETSRHNRATEGVAWFTAKEDARHNLANEVEANRHNTEQENQAKRNWREDVRHNVRSEQTSLYSAKAKAKLDESSTKLNEERVDTEKSTQFKNYTYGAEKITKSINNVSEIAAELGETVSSIVTIGQMAGVL